MRRFRPLTPVIDVRNPEVIGTFQTHYKRADCEMAQVRFSRTRIIPVPLRYLKRYFAPRVYPKNRKSTQARDPYKSLSRLRGWTREECDRQAKMAGLSVRQVLQAFTE